MKKNENEGQKRNGGWRREVANGLALRLRAEGLSYRQIEEEMGLAGNGTRAMRACRTAGARRRLAA